MRKIFSGVKVIWNDEQGPTDIGGAPGETVLLQDEKLQPLEVRLGILLIQIQSHGFSVSKIETW